ncbi:ribosomal RNA small subunit methyltransferase A [Candidatus Peregrinibacteria bacterium]|nr:MAG: ribosomal RNA small subunit methyltransferase A [Candidatus Peregrinibacteria bacterium]
MLLDQLKSLLKQHNLWAKKQYGQNFLIDESVHETILNAANLDPTDTVVEVGPGTGFLTERLIKQVNHVTAVEKDADMVVVLQSRFVDKPNLAILQSDILAIQNYKIQNSRFKVVANIPYYITSPILKHFLQSNHRPVLMVLMVQKEVAEKICSIGDVGVISIETQVFGRPEIVATVPPEAFYPPPKVHSAILKIDVYDQPLILPDQLKSFFRLVKFGFSQKRKKLANTLAAGLHQSPALIREALIKSGISPDVRAEDLSIEDWKRLTTCL